MAALGRQYGAPLDRDNLKYSTDNLESNVRSAARALTCTKVRGSGRGGWEWWAWWEWQVR